MAEVIWSPRAADQLVDIAAYIRRDDPVAAALIADRLFALGESLSDFPDRGRPATNGTRELTSVPPYVLRYRVKGGRVVIIHVRHGRRRPI